MTAMKKRTNSNDLLSADVPVSQLNYEEALSELETIVTALETDEKNLEQAIRLFERGQELARYCATLIDNAEMKIKQITGDELVEFNDPG